VRIRVYLIVFFVFVALTYKESKFELYDRVGIKNMSKTLKKLKCIPKGVVVNHKKVWENNKYMVLLYGCTEKYWYDEDRLWKSK